MMGIDSDTEGRLRAFWEGMLAGYGIAIPVGAIAVLIVETGLRDGLGPAVVAGAGAATADFFYAGLAAAAGGTLAALLTPFAQPMRFLSGLVLLGLGGLGLWRLRERPARGIPVRRSAIGLYAQFLGLTLLNPLTVAYFGALILGTDPNARWSLGERAAFVLGAGLASLSWQSLLAGIGALARQRLSTRTGLLLGLFGNLIVLGLGLRLLLRTARLP